MFVIKALVRRRRRSGPSRGRVPEVHPGEPCVPGEAMFAIKVSHREVRARSAVERVTGPSRPGPGRGHESPLAYLRFTRGDRFAPGCKMFVIKTLVRRRRRAGPSRGRAPRVHPGELVLPRGSNVRDKGVARRSPRSFSRRARDRPEPPRPRTRTRIPPGIPEVHPGGPCVPGEAMFVIKTLVRRRRRSGPSRAPRPEVHPGEPVRPRGSNVRDKDFCATSPTKRPIPRPRTRSSPG